MSQIRKTTSTSSQSFDLNLVVGANTICSKPVQSMTFYRGGDHAQITVLANHAPLLTTINGPIIIHPLSGPAQTFVVEEATFSFGNNQASVFATALKTPVKK